MLVFRKVLPRAVDFNPRLVKFRLIADAAAPNVRFLTQSIKRLPASSSARRLRPACAVICRRANRKGCFPAIHCVPGSRPRLRSTSARCKAAWPHYRRDDPKIPAPARSIPGQPHQGERAIGHKKSPPLPRLHIWGRIRHGAPTAQYLNNPNTSHSEAAPP